MRVLVNYSADERQFLPQLQYYMKKEGITGVSTSKELTATELQTVAKGASCEAILLCNTVTLQHLVPGKKATLDLWRGSRLNYKIPIIVLNSLAHINTVTHGSWLLQQDLMKTRNVKAEPKDHVWQVLDTIEKIRDIEDYLSGAVLLSFDIETDKVDPVNDEDDSVEGPASIITCCSWTAMFADGRLETFVLPLIDFGYQDHWRTNEEYAEALAFMRRINKLPCPKIMHNGIYDCAHTIRYNAEPENYVLDTLGLAHSTYSELPKTLDFVASYHLFDYCQWKTLSDDAKDAGDQRSYWQYNALDTWYTMRIAISQLKSMPSYALRNYAARFKMVYPCLYMEFEGWKVDNTKRVKLKAEAEKKLTTALTELRIALADPNFNPGSWQQVGHYIYNVLGARKPKIKSSSKAGTSEKHLIAVSEQHPILAMIVDRILEYRKAQKAISNYFEFKQLGDRALYIINPFGTESGRSSSQASSFWVGLQVQNIPEYAKEMLVADEGFEAAEVDNEQSEARCVAYLAGCQALIDALETPGKDFYRTLGTLFFGLAYEDVTDFIRNKVIKKIVHGTNYVMGPGTYIENVGVKLLYESAAILGLKLVEVPRRGRADEMTVLQFAKHCLMSYHKPFPEIKVEYGAIKQEIYATGLLTSPSGYTRKFFGDIEKNNQVLRSAIAHKPQNLSVMMVDRVVWRLYKELVLPSQGEFRLKMQVHDSIGAQWPIEKRDYYGMKMKAICDDNPIDIRGRTLRIPTSMKLGTTWGTMQKVHLTL